MRRSYQEYKEATRNTHTLPRVCVLSTGVVLWASAVRWKVQLTEKMESVPSRCMDKHVSEVLHPLPNAKIHAELAHCGERFLAARSSHHTTGRPHLVHTAEWLSGDSYLRLHRIVPAKVHTAVPTRGTCLKPV